jgi:purine-nucleoside phosphorylase
VTDRSPDPETIVSEAARTVTQLVGDRGARIAVVLGSGMASFVAQLDVLARLPFHDIPGFPAARVEGHVGELIAGTLGGIPVLCQSGRFHRYEGHPVSTVVLPVRVFARLGIEILILTNAAGGLRPGFAAGTLMLIADQLNFSFQSGLAGPAGTNEIRFPDMSDPFDTRLRAAARDVALQNGIPLEEGVYAGVLGPSYETPAEIRMLRRLGADAVGMSTVLEVAVARAAGIRCLGISTITNLASGLAGAPLAHEEVVRVADSAGAQLKALLSPLVERI